MVCICLSDLYWPMMFMRFIRPYNILQHLATSLFMGVSWSTPSRISEASVYSRFNWYVRAALFPAAGDVPGRNPFGKAMIGCEQLPFISIYLIHGWITNFWKRAGSQEGGGFSKLWSCNVLAFAENMSLKWWACEVTAWHEESNIFLYTGRHRILEKCSNWQAAPVYHRKSSRPFLFPYFLFP